MKTTTIKLEGGTLVLGPLLASTLRDFKDKIAAAGANQLAPIDMVDLTVTLATAAARRIDPRVTEDHVAGLVDLENFGRVFSACWGVTVPESPPGNRRVKASRSN